MIKMFIRPGARFQKLKPKPKLICPCQRDCGAKHETKKKIKGTGK